MQNERAALELQLSIKLRLCKYNIETEFVLRSSIWPWSGRQDFFLTVRAGTAYRHGGTFFQVKKKELVLMYSITDLRYFRLVSTGTYYLVPSEYRHLFLKKKALTLVEMPDRI